MRRLNINKLNSIAIALCLLLIVNLQVFAETWPGKIDKTAHGSILVRFVDADNKPITGGNVELYKVAGVADDSQGNDVYVPESDFCKSGLDYTRLMDAEFASEAGQFASAHGISGEICEVDPNGQAKYEDLEVGIYLITQPIANDGWYAIDPYVVTLPLNEQGIWNYNVDSLPKMEPLAPILSPTPTLTPSSTPSATPSSSPTPSPSATQSSSPTPSLSPIPSDPISTLTPTPYTEEGSTVTSTPSPTPTPTDSLTEGDKVRLPQTGQLNWPIPVLAFAGLLLFIIGFGILRRENSEE